MSKSFRSPRRIAPPHGVASTPYSREDISSMAQAQYPAADIQYANTHAVGPSSPSMEVPSPVSLGAKTSVTSTTRHNVATATHETEPVRHRISERTTSEPLAGMPGDNIQQFDHRQALHQ